MSWFGQPPSTSIDLPTDDSLPQYGSSHDAVQEVFKSNKCYDLMSTSCKVVVFEAAISFQLAFNALVEHDAEVAPLWDPNGKVFLGIMTTVDFIEALSEYQRQGLSLFDLSNRTIADMLLMPKDTFVFKHNNFLSLGAEESVYQLYCLLRRLKTEFAPIVDPLEGNLVGVLGYLDILYLLAHSAQQYPIVASVLVQQLTTINISNQVTAPKTACLGDVCKVMHDRQLSAVPIVDEDGRVIGVYQLSDVSFIAKAPQPDIILSNFSSMNIGDVAITRTNDNIQNGLPGFCSCMRTSSLKEVVEAMISFRVTRAVCIDEMGRYVAIVDVKDILTYFFGE